MTQERIRSTILKALYEAFFNQDSPVDLDKIRQGSNLDDASFWSEVDKLASDGVIKVRAMGRSYRISAIGVLAVEEEGLVTDELIQQNRHVRTVALDELVRVYDEQRFYSDSHVESLAKITGLDVYAVVLNMRVLDNLGYVSPTTFSGSYMPTERGRTVVERWRQHSALLTELERVRGLFPQQRGREFQHLLAKVIGLSGWSCEENVRTSYEEMDIFVHKNRDYYLIECKWEKNPIEAIVVQALIGKLNGRKDVHGILASMSGFSSGVEERVANATGQNLILLFGEQDITDMIQDKASFDDLVAEKYHKLVTQRVVVYK